MTRYHYDMKFVGGKSFAVIAPSLDEALWKAREAGVIENSGGRTLAVLQTYSFVPADGEHEGLHS